MDDAEGEEEEEELDETKAALRKLLVHCMFARRAEALALLDLQPGLLNLRWAGVGFAVNRKWAGRNTTALIVAGKGGDLALVLALLERGADLHARDDFNRTALIGAAYWAHPEVCELLLSRGADLMAKDDDGETALSLYGLGSGLTPAAKEAGRQRLREAWASGPHPSQVQRRRDENWARRWPLVQVLVLGGFQPLAARRALLQQTALPPDVALPRLPCATAAERLGLVRAKVWSHPGIWRAIAAFL
jgi:hypothetical protein